MEIKELQNKAVETVKERLAKKDLRPSIELSMLHLVEELGELTSQIMNGKLKRKEVNIKNIGEEISDCVIMLMVLADQYDINLEKEILEKIKEIKNKNLS